MIRRAALNEFAREWLHAVRNNKSMDEAAELGLAGAKKNFDEEAAHRTDFDYDFNWDQVIDCISVLEPVLRQLPIDPHTIPPKAEMPAVSLQKLKQEGKRNGG